MRKRVLSATTVAPVDEWLDLSEIATVEVTSEADGYPAESVFQFGPNDGWRADGTGEQVLRLVFDEPRTIKRVQLEFRERHQERTQEFTLASDRGEIVRQQWSFSPDGSTSELEDYRMDLPQVRMLELRLKPDLSPERATASLQSWRVA